MQKRMDEAIRQKVFKRDGYKCRYCGCVSNPLHADHVYPYSKGGETSMNNMVTSCDVCNHKKHNKIGMWPKPLGYFNEREKISKEAILGIRKEGSFLISGLLLWGFYAVIFLPIHNDISIIIVKSLSWITFSLFIFLAFDWIRKFFRGE